MPLRGGPVVRFGVGEMSDTSQGPGWWQAADGKWYAPEQHPDYQPPAAASAPPPPSAAVPPVSGPGPVAGAGPVGGAAASVPSFAFDVKRWTQAERITGIASLVLFISLFLPWFTYNVGFGVGSVSVDGLWHGWMYLVLLLCLAIFAYLVARAGFGELPFKLPLANEQLLLIATGINAVLTILAFL